MPARAGRRRSVLVDRRSVVRIGQAQASDNYRHIGAHGSSWRAILIV